MLIIVGLITNDESRKKYEEITLCHHYLPYLLQYGRIFSSFTFVNIEIYLGHKPKAVRQHLIMQQNLCIYVKYMAVNSQSTCTPWY